MNSYIYEIECNNVPISDGDFIDLIYVGCTKKIPEKRYKEHKTGKRANKFAQFYGTNLKSFPQNFLDSEYLVELEQLHAETLRTNGHYVVSGKEAYRDKPIICPKCYDKTLAIGCDRKKKTPLIFCDNEECTFKCDEPESLKNILSGDYANVFNNDPRTKILNGLGYRHSLDGDLFVGYLKDGKKHGYGTLTLGTGEKYEGEWRYDKKHGNGTLTSQDGIRYIGNYKFGRIWNGKGCEVFGNEKYEGEFVEGKRHGNGTLKVKGAIKYKGEWRDDEKNGYGTCIDPDGKKYKGDFLDGKRHGNGTLVDAYSSVYVGQFNNDSSTCGKIFWSDGLVYDKLNGTWDKWLDRNPWTGESIDLLEDFMSTEDGFGVEID